MGREYSGKSTLCKNFVEIQSQYEGRDSSEFVDVSLQDRTQGVSIYRTHRGEDCFFFCRNLELVFLDFGGHALYHCAHEFFMSDPNYMVVVALSPFEPSYDGLASDSSCTFRLCLPSFRHCHGLFPQRLCVRKECELLLSPSESGHLTEVAVPSGSLDPYVGMGLELRHWLTMIMAHRKVPSSIPQFSHFLYFMERRKGIHASSVLLRTPKPGASSRDVNPLHAIVCFGRKDLFEYDEKRLRITLLDIQEAFPHVWLHTDLHDQGLEDEGWEPILLDFRDSSSAEMRKFKNLLVWRA